MAHYGGKDCEGCAAIRPEKTVTDAAHYGAKNGDGRGALILRAKNCDRGDTLSREKFVTTVGNMPRYGAKKL